MNVIKMRSRWWLLIATVLLFTACSDETISHPTRVPPETTNETTATKQPAAPAPTNLHTVIPDDQQFRAAREVMVQTNLMTRDIDDPAVLDAMMAVPRHSFVLADYLDQAYADHPLPIGYGQTISQPYIVALMTQMLDLKPEDKVLEIGTGSGYQAAVLAEIVDEVYTIEIIGALVERAARTLEATGYTNVHIQHSDGYFGWEEQAPFDAIIVTAAPDHVPPPLRAQLADGGKMVIPVGPVGSYQELWLIERQGDEFTTTSLGGVAFVPLTREERDE